MKEKVYLVECKNCGMFEEQPVDQQRHHIQNFEQVERCTDEFICNCGEKVTGKVVEV